MDPQGNAVAVWRQASDLWANRLAPQAPFCGDGTINPGEDCDDGGESATCDADCTTVTCGDGAINTTAGEACDPPDGVACDASCQLIIAAGWGTPETIEARAGPG